jgi:hypothetical protein
MNKHEVAGFTVRIFSVNHATWQGEVTSDGETFSFRSELELLKWLYQKHPQLRPDPASRPEE